MTTTLEALEKLSGAATTAQEYLEILQRSGDADSQDSCTFCLCDAIGVMKLADLAALAEPLAKVLPLLAEEADAMRHASPSPGAGYIPWQVMRARAAIADVLQGRDDA